MALCVVKDCQSSLDVVWHLVESISVSSACSWMCMDLVGTSSMSLSCGFSTTSRSGRFEYDGTDVVNVNHHELCLVCHM